MVSINLYSAGRPGPLFRTVGSLTLSRSRLPPTAAGAELGRLGPQPRCLAPSVGTRSVRCGMEVLMGVFFEAEPVEPKVREAIRDALATDPEQVDTAREAAERARTVAEDIRRGSRFQTGRFLIALAIFASVVLAAII